METEPYYLRVGVFSALALCAFVWFLSLFLMDGPEDNFKRYAIYFKGAVSGLDEGAPVKLRGIDVGHVETISFNAEYDDVIEVLVDIKRGAPIRDDTVASVRFQGITGNTYVFLQNTKTFQESKLLEKRHGQPYPVIRSNQSDLYAALSSAPEVLGKFSNVATQIESLLDEQNVMHVSSILAQIDQFVGRENQGSFARLINNFNHFLSNQNADNLEVLLYNTNKMVVEATDTIREYKMLAKTLRDDPSRVLRGPKHQGHVLND